MCGVFVRDFLVMTKDYPEAEPMFLSTLSPGYRERRLAKTVLLISAMLFVVALPFSRFPLAPVPLFIPVYETVLVVIDVITAVLLFGQYVILGSRALFCLACGYLFTGFIEVVHALTFPGAFSASGLLSGGAQSTAWVYIFWHGGFPLFVGAYVILKARENPDDRLRTGHRQAIVKGVTAILAIVSALALLATAGNDSLPVVMSGNYSTATLTVAVSIILALCLGALLLLWRRRPHSVLDLWLIVVMCAWLFEIGLSSMFNAGRYDLGYYVGRVYGCLATGFVLMMLLLENGALYARLAEAHVKTKRKSTELEAMSVQLEDANERLAQKNRQLIEANQLKSEFLANMSHELRTPLNAIIGFSDVLKDGLVGELTAEQQDYITDIFSSGQHLLSLINDLLDLSKIEAGKMTLDLESIEIVPLLRNCLIIVKEKAAEHQVSLKLDITEPLEPFHGDARKIKQIIYNLLSNAVKFTPDHGVITLKARVARRDEIECWTSSALTKLKRPLPESDFSHFLELSVTDTGRGISSLDAPRLFHAFSQLDSSLARDCEGTGLGLALVLRLAQLHQGTVALASSPDVGSCFTVWLPWRESSPDSVPCQSPEAAKRLAAAPGFGSMDAGKRNALVIEDNQHAAELISLQLKSAGFQIMHATSATQALDILASGLPMLIVLDILLPDMDGWEFLAQIKRSEGPLAQVPIVIVSIAADRVRGYSLGAAKVLQKPVSRGELLETLDELGLNGRAQASTILVIDDDPAAVELLSTCLAAQPCKVLRAYGGKEGIEMCCREKPDLIVLDLLMPEVSGFDVIAAIALHTETAAIPIVVVTAKNLSAEERSKLGGHVGAIVEKSDFDRVLFGREIQSALAGETLHRKECRTS